MVERDLAKVDMRVRFPSLAPLEKIARKIPGFFPSYFNYNGVIMSRGFFSYLNWAVPKTRSPSAELSYINRNQSACPDIGRKYLDLSTPYGVRRSFIFLRSLKRRQAILSLLKDSDPNEILKNKGRIKTLFDGMPYFLYHQTKVFFPFYTPFINQRMLSDISSFYSFPYDAFLKDPDCSLINPFFEYGSHIFDRKQTRRKKLDVCDIDSSSYYLEEEGVLFFIDSRGYLETRIPFFDENRKQKDRSHLKERLESIAKDYYSNDFAKLSQNLISLKLLSPKVVLSAIKSKERQYKERNEDDL